MIIIEVWWTRENYLLKMDPEISQLIRTSFFAWTQMRANEVGGGEQGRVKGQ